tara:strand:- start:1344 stop:1574 length:231 start_codon:yes stop_codon:yes gene_type:complete
MDHGRHHRYQRAYRAHQTHCERGLHTTEDEVFEASRSLGVGDFKNADRYFGGFNGNAGWERHPSGDELVHVIAGAT